MSVTPNEEDFNPYASAPPVLDVDADFDLDATGDDFDSDDASDADDFDLGDDSYLYADDDADMYSTGAPPPVAASKTDVDQSDDPDLTGALPGVPLTDADAEWLREQAALTTDFLALPRVQATLRSITAFDQLPKGRRWAVDKDAPEGVMFGWFDPSTDSVTWQFRPHKPRSKDAKYTFRKGAGSPVALRSRPLDTTPVGHTVLIVEGTKQSLAVASALAHDASYVVYAIAGCRGGFVDGRLNPTLKNAVKGAKRVVLIPDADAAVNADVYNGFESLGKNLRAYVGNRRGVIQFAQVPPAAGGKSGIDDVLASLPVIDRAQAITDLLDEAILAPAPVRPRSKTYSKDGTTYYERFSGGLRVAACVDALMKDHHLAYDADGRALLCYSDKTGVYDRLRTAKASREPELVEDFLTDVLGDDWRLDHARHVTAALESRVRRLGRIIPSSPTHGLLHVANGMVDLETGDLLPHDAKYMSVSRLNVTYDPDATCPTIDAWLREATTLADGTDQLDITLDTLSALLDSASGLRTPDKGLYLLGESRAGKGTLLNGLVAHMIPQAYRSSVTLMDMADRKAPLILTMHRKIANLSGETPEGYIADASVFKSLLGMDEITLDVKFKDAIAFYNTAFPIFTANDMPHITDISGAVGARLTFVLFPRSHVGKEDRGITARLQAELPGFLNALIAARKARKARDWQYLPSAAQAAERFVRETNPIAEFVAECVEIAPADAWRGSSVVADAWTTSKTDLYNAYVEYSRQTGSKSLKRVNFLKALSRKPFNVAGITSDVYSDLNKARRLACRLKDDEEV